MIEEGIIKQMVTLPSNMFSSVTLPATLWFFDKEKANTERKDEILFIDARNIFTQVDRAHRKFSDEQIKNLGLITKLYDGDINAYNDLLNEYENKLNIAPEKSNDDEIKPKIYCKEQIDWIKERFPEGKYQDVIGLCKAAKIDEEDGIKEQDYSLNAGRYGGVVIEDDGMTQEEFKDYMLTMNKEIEKIDLDEKQLQEKIVMSINEILGD